MTKNKINNRLINITVLVFLLMMIYLSFNIWWKIIMKGIIVFLPFIVAFVFAYIFNPFVNFLEKKKVKRKIAVFIVVISILIFLGWLFAISLPMVCEQLIALIKMIVKAINTFDTKYDINLGPLKIQIVEFLNTMLKQVGSTASTSILEIAGKSFGVFGQIIVGFVGFIYFLLDMEKLKSCFASFLKKIGKKWFNYFKLMDTEISNYLKGLGIYILVKTVEYSLLFFLIGHPNWMILGLLVCVMTFVPYFGGLITNIIAVVTASVVSIKLAIFTLLICIIGSITDSYIVSPKIYGKTNRVNPLISIMAVSVGGTILGPVGVVVALPCFLLLRTTYKFFEKDFIKCMTIVKKTI